MKTIWSMMRMQICNNTNLCITPVVLGCTDINAINYNPFANVDDDSCTLHLR